MPFSNSTSQGLEPSAASPQTLALLDGVPAEGEAGAEARRRFQDPATTTVRSCRLAHVPFPTRGPLTLLFLF